MCYDRTSVGRKPMCATVCPSGALSYTTREEIERTRKGRIIHAWRFGEEEVRTKVALVVPEPIEKVYVDLVQIEALPVAQRDRYDVADLLEGGL
jgi:Fe-S-cluster-containing dehydrogenase component